MTIQTIINGSRNISKNRRANVDFTRTLGGVVKQSRSGPFITTFNITPNYPTQAEHDAFIAEYQRIQIGPYTLSFTDFAVRTNGAYNPAFDNPVVNVGSQTGSLIDLSGFRASTTAILAAGDTLQFDGVPFTYTVIQDARSDVSGDLTVALDQPVASSPAGNSTVRIGSEIQWNLFLEQVPDELGVSQLPYNVSYGSTFILREGR